MRIELLGTGGYHPSERRHTACLLLPDQGILFDAGTAAFRIADRLRSPTLDVFLSHAHLDHVIGLTYLLVPLARGQLRRVTIHAMPATIEAIRSQLFHPSLFPILPAFEFSPLQAGETVQVSPGVIIHHWLQLSHPGTSCGFRLDCQIDARNRSLSYVTDTTVDGSYTNSICHSDLLLHECYFPDSARDWAQKTGHSCLGDVLRLARAAAVKRLVLLHIDPQMADDTLLGLTAEDAAGLSVSIARDGDILEV